MKTSRSLPHLARRDLFRWKHGESGHVKVVFLCFFLRIRAFPWWSLQGDIYQNLWQNGCQVHMSKEGVSCRWIGETEDKTGSEFHVFYGPGWFKTARLLKFKSRTTGGCEDRLNAVASGESNKF